MAKGNSGRRWWAWFASLLLHMVVAVSLLVRLPAPRPQAASDQVRVIQAQLIDTTVHQEYLEGGFPAVTNALNTDDRLEVALCRPERPARYRRPCHVQGAPA